MSDNRVFVLDSNKQILAPCHPCRARKLLNNQKAAVFRLYPFTIILKRKIPSNLIDDNPITIKIDPGSRTTGMVLVMSTPSGDRCIYGLNIEHRGLDIVNNLISRSIYKERITVRSNERFDIRVSNRNIFSTIYYNCIKLFCKDGYKYTVGTEITTTFIISKEDNIIELVKRNIVGKFKILKTKVLDNNNLVYSINHFI